MATIEKYATKTGEFYRVRYRTPEGRQTDKRGFRTKKLADAFAASVEVAKLRGEFVSEAAGKITIGEIWPRWIATKGTLKPSYLRTLRIAWETHVEERWGGVAVGKVRRSDVKEWVHSMGKSASVARRAHGILAGILDIAVDDKNVYANLARGIPLPKKTRKPNRYLTLAQVEALATQAKTHGPLVWFLATTGLRWGEAVALDGRHLNRRTGMVSVEQTATMVEQELAWTTPKSGSIRKVPVPKSVLARIPKVLPGAILWPTVAQERRTYPPGKDSWLDGAVQRCQKVDPAFPSVSVHDLRHTAASLAVSAGASVKAVQRMLGHTSAAMTLDVYSDLFDDDLKAVAVAVDAKIVAECGQNVGTAAS